MTRNPSWKRLLALSLSGMAALISCGDPGVKAPSALTEGDGGFIEPTDAVPSSRSCVDEDRDGFGDGCVAGPDCDDDNAAVTRECRACLRPATGCPCQDDEPPAACDMVTDTTEPGPEGVCHLGQRTCRQGTWSTCESFESLSRVIGVVSNCYGSCDMSCQHIVDCIEPTDTLPAGSSLAAVSSVDPAVFCPAGTLSGGVQPQCVNRPGGAYIRAVSPGAWVDACAATGATVLMPNMDESIATVSLPFAFSFWGVPYRTINITPNGVLQFTAPTSVWVNTTIPAPSSPSSIFAFWDDLMTRATGVCVATVGTAPNRRTIFEWNDAVFYPTYDPAVHLTFEVILNESGQSIDVVYNTMTGPDARATGNSATIGVQENAGTRFDLVSYNTGGVATSGTAFRWTPATNDLYCQSATYHRVFQAACPASTVPVATIPTWGRMNFTSLVPPGATLQMQVRVADTEAGLATATPIRLPDAPRTSGNVPLLGTYDVGDLLQNATRGLAHKRFLDFTAYFNPGPDSNLVPVLGSMEVQFNCRPVEGPYQCTAGSPCQTAGVCRRGVVTCPQRLNPVCTDVGPMPAGTSCGLAQVCNGAGSCVACNEGAACSTGNACQYGRISCATGAPVCVAYANRPLGTICAFGSGNYTRGTSPLGYIDICALPGAVRYLPTDQDSVTVLTMPFPFRLYGSTYTSVGAGVNGILTFPSGSTAWTNTTIPSAGLGDAIMPFWDDLQTRPTGICSGTVGTAPARYFGVQWANVDLQDRGTTGNLGASLNFEVLLEEATQAVHVLYGDMVGDSRALGASATVGIQSAAGTYFEQVSYNTATVVPNSSIRWVPPTASVCSASGVCTACASTETCNGVDDNCNGLIDEGIPDISCGVGVCRRTIAACVLGVSQTCTPGTSSTETCNGLDDDCDGMVDEACAGTIACPADASMFAGDTLSFSVTTGGMLRNFTWTLLSYPAGGDTTVRWNPTPPTSMTETFSPIIVGVYRIQVSAIDGLNQTRSCAFNVTANSRGLRVELTWNGTGDVDVHLHNNVSGAWFNAPNDCHYANMNPAWGASQDVDNVTSNGPENIRMNTPAVGQTYTVAVHNYARAAGRVATVKIYCGPTAGTTPSVIYTSPTLTGSSSGNCTSNMFWKVANVRINSDGSCTITPINTTTTSSAACTTR